MSAAKVIPICCVCNRVREHVRVEGSWEPWDTLGAYLRRHHLSSGEYQLSHTYCPTCAMQFSKVNKISAEIPRQVSGRTRPGDDVAATILNVFDGLQKCDLDMLIRACPSLTWNQVFSEVDRLSRMGQLRLSYLGQGHYSIELPQASKQPLVTQS